MKYFGCLVFYLATLNKDSAHSWWKRGVSIVLKLRGSLWKACCIKTVGTSISAHRSWYMHHRGTVWVEYVCYCLSLHWRDDHWVFSIKGTQFIFGRWPSIQEPNHWGKSNPSILSHYFHGSHSYMLSMALMSIFKLQSFNPVALAGLYTKFSSFI